MVQIIPPNYRKSFAEKVLGGINEAIPEIQGYFQQQQQRRALENQQEAMRSYGQKLGIEGLESFDPSIQKEIIGKTLQGAAQSQKMQDKLKMLQELGLFGKDNEAPNERVSNLMMSNEGNFSNLENEEFLTSKKRNAVPYSKNEILAASLVDPQLANLMQKQNDQVLEEERHIESLQEKSRKRKIEEYQISPEGMREKELTVSQAKSDSDFYKNLQESEDKSILKEESLNRLEKINNKDVSGKAYESILEKLGLVALTSEGRRELAAEVKNQYTDFKSIVGSQMSASEFFTLTNAYPSPDFSKSANKAIIENLKDLRDTLRKKYEIAQKLKKENKGKIPEFFQEKVNEQLRDYSLKKLDKMKSRIRRIQAEQYGLEPGKVLMFDDEGNEYSIPDDPESIEKAMSEGAFFQ